MRQTNRYLLEGESEQNLVCSLRSAGVIAPGRQDKLNMWEVDVATRIRTFDAREIVIIVFDTDVTNELQRFLTNINLLSKKVKAVVLLPQHPNLEPELAYACSIPPRSLPNHLYRVKSVSELKKKLAKDRSLANTLKRKGFDIN